MTAIIQEGKCATGTSEVVVWVMNDAWLLDVFGIEFHDELNIKYERVGRKCPKHSWSRCWLSSNPQQLQSPLS